MIALLEGDARSIEAFCGFLPPLLTMSLCGLWHGAGWSYVINVAGRRADLRRGMAALSAAAARAGRLGRHRVRRFAGTVRANETQCRDRCHLAQVNCGCL